jgi:uncharacterized protein (TIGR02453 family)
MTTSSSAATGRGRRPKALDPGDFTGFSDETMAFYAGLEADNSKAYFTDHKSMFEQAVRGPMLALLAALEPEFGPAKLFRANRDIRFSADKSPYKNHQGAVVTHPGGTGSYYVQVNANGLLLGGGLFHLATDQLARYRAGLDGDRTGAPMARTVRGLTKNGWELIGDSLVRVPRGFAPDHPRADLLRHKSIALSLDVGDPDWFTSSECVQQVADGWRALGPFLSWLGKHVGPAGQDGNA